MISALIPAYNEAERLPYTIAGLLALAPELRPDEIVVVDDGSRDDTAGAARRNGATSVIVQTNQGKGTALTAAFAASCGDILLLVDADVGETSGEAALLLAPVLRGECDMAIAKFPVIPGKGGGAGFVVKLARRGIERLTGREMSAPLSGQRAVRREVIERCGGFAQGWGVEVSLTVRAIRAGFRVTEIETQMTHRVTGRKAADILHRARQYAAAARVLKALERE